MHSRARTIRLELEHSPDSLTGRACPDCGADKEFSGWLGMVAAIDALLADQGDPMSDSMTMPTLALVTPDDVGYDAARQAFNLLADQRPAAVARPTSAAEVAAVVSYARENGLRIAPQSTGHNPPTASLAGSVLLRTDRMRGVTIDAERRVAYVEAGAEWEDVTTKAAEHGLAGLAGSSPNVGVAGYALGGGLSWLARSKGLATNHVIAFEVVMADGRQVRVDRDNEPELFWALRGGGGSFAVATAFEIELFPIAEVYAGMLVFPWERAAEVLKAWREWTHTAPDAVTTSARVMQIPPLPDVPEPLRGRGLVVIDGAYDGAPEDGERVLAPLRELGPEMDTFARIPAAALSMIHMDPLDPLPAASTTAVLRDLPEEGIDALVEAVGPGSGSPLVTVELRQLGGAVGRVPEGAGALGKIGGAFLWFALGITPDAGVLAAVEAHLPVARAAVAPYESGRDYLNFAERAVDPQRFYSEDAYRRLQAVKAQYDPQDVFQSNHPIPPTR
ncbi:MAG: hypothetical protein QOJ07_24 [Thermoleophilaceae bacterium]|nr:hypothetical protein [Thermoleophilaceae bacterium]